MTEREHEMYLDWAERHGWDPEDPETALYWEAAMADKADRQY